jgi:hypothetical protein
MNKEDTYRQALGGLHDWDEYLMAESGLPGPRGNLELAQVVADMGDAAMFQRYLSYDPTVAPENSPRVFLVFCGVVGLGRLLAEGQRKWLRSLKGFANDPRWRVREAVAMALQRWGDHDMPALLMAMAQWGQGSLLEQRAAAAALCEPKLLIDRSQVCQVLALLDTITAGLVAAADRQGEDFKTLRKGLAYCWSVAVVAAPADGKPLMEKWLASADKDIRWIMRENLKKNRLLRMDPAWVAICRRPEGSC